MVGLGIILSKVEGSKEKHIAGENMPKRIRSYETGLFERLRDPSYAMEYLRAALEDEDDGASAVFLQALRDVEEANR